MITSQTHDKQAATPADTVRQVVNVIVLVATLIVNYLANALPFNGKTTGQISDQFPVYFVPAGYVFAIWGVIYLALTAFTVYQALPSQRANPLMRRIGYLFAFSSIANTMWLFLWHYEQFTLTMIVMLVLLVTLIAIYLRLDIGRAPVSTREKWLVHVPFSIYLGWITVATIANATDLLYHLGWDGWGISGQTWAAVMLVAATLIASAVAVTRIDLAYALVIVWAFAGIAVKQWSTPEVAIPAAVLAGVVAVVWALSAALARPGKRSMRPSAV